MLDKHMNSETSKKKFMEKFSLIEKKSVKTSNMVLFDSNGNIKHIHLSDSEDK